MHPNQHSPTSCLQCIILRKKETLRGQMQREPGGREGKTSPLVVHGPFHAAMPLGVGETLQGKKKPAEIVRMTEEGKGRQRRHLQLSQGPLDLQ